MNKKPTDIQKTHLTPYRDEKNVRCDMMFYEKPKKRIGTLSNE